MRRAQRGNSTAYLALLTEIGAVIEKFLRARFGPVGCLEDLVQECLLAVHGARHTYDPDRPFRPWMFTVVRHRAVDCLRREPNPARCGDGRPEQVETGTDAEHVARLLDGQRILDALQPDHREVVLMTKYLGMTTAETADQLHISEHAVKARLRRGLDAIRRLLAAEQDR